MSMFEEEMHITISMAKADKAYEGIISLIEAYKNSTEEKRVQGCTDILDFITAAIEQFDLSEIRDYVKTQSGNNFSVLKEADASLHKIQLVARGADKGRKRNRKRQLFAEWMSDSFHYEFDQEDHDRLQVLVNELREEIKKFKKIEEPHRARLLSRLEHLQAELHKKVSDLDKFWGMVGDAGVALGKFGKDAEPFVSRIREMTGIVWKAQRAAEGLPQDAPLPRLEDKSGQ